MSASRRFAGPHGSELVAPSSDVSARMARVRRADTKPEVELRRLLHALGLRFRIDKAVGPDRRRRVDIVFGPSRVAVFVDGCFWHACPEHGTLPRNNCEFWAAKLAANVQRDRDTDRVLSQAGWCVLRIWEHEDMVDAAARIERAVRERRAGP